MRQFNLKQRNSVIRTLKETPAKKKGTNWQRLLFIGLLAFLLFLVGRRVYRAVFVIYGDGQVVLAKQAVQFTDDIRMSSILVEEGDTVNQGDTLFYYRFEATDEELNAMADAYDPVDWVIRERLNTKKQIALKKIELSRIRQQIDFKEAELIHQRDLIILGVDEIESKLTYIQEAIIRMRGMRSALNREIYYLRQHLKELSLQADELRNQEIRKAGRVGSILPYVANIDGIIGQINLSPNEVCYEQQDVLAIHQLNSISIKAFFDPYDVPKIERGDEVWVQFPDGTESKGLIKNFYVSTYAVPKEFQKKYEPTERNIVAEVIPLNEFEVDRWQRFYKMSVQVSKYRYEWPW